MAVSETIQEILQGIDDAQYGRDMRQYIHKGIQKCYEEGSAGETDLQARSDIADILTNFGDVEESTTASKDYDLGDSLVLGNILYKVTAEITEGDTLTEGTNIEKTNVSNSGSLGDVYRLDFTKNHNYTDSSKLFIIPSIRLLMLNICCVIPANTALGSDSLYSHLPYVRGFIHNLSGQTVSNPVFLYTSGSTPTFTLGYARYISLTNSSSRLYVDAASSTSERIMTGTIVAMYRYLDDLYPMSSATLVS